MAKRLLLLLLLNTFLQQALAQQTPERIFNKYVNGFAINYQLTMFLTNPSYYNPHNIGDSVYIDIKSVNDVQQIINSGYCNRIFAAKIENRDTTHLENIFTLLAKLPNLEFLKIDDMILFSFKKNNRKEYQLPASIAALHQLKGIEFSFTEALNMPDAFSKIASIKKLQCISFSLYNNRLPQNINLLNNVRAVKISSRNLDSLDISGVKWKTVALSGDAPKVNNKDEEALIKLSKIPTLKNLHLDYYMLGNCNVFTRFKQLTTLKITSSYQNKPAQLFQKIGELTQLKQLSVGFLNDTLQNLAGIENLKNLTSFELIYPSQLKSHPEQLLYIGKLRKLQKLTINSSQIGIMPDIFSGLKHLRSLNLASDALTQIPNSVFELGELEYLNLSENKLRKLPDSAGYNCHLLKSLVLSYNGLNILPRAIVTLQTLRVLNASRNKITSIPTTGWQNLTQLVSADLSSNRISTFPDGLQQISSLETLDISDNNIDSIADIKGSGYKLKTLNVSGNNLKLLPPHLGKYTELTNFDASGNILSELPESLGNCTKLVDLNLQSASRKISFDADKTGSAAFTASDENPAHVNHIKALPDGLKNTAHLYQLKLSNNKGIDGASVFNVILGSVRKSFYIDAGHCDIAVVPESDQWANMTFGNFYLNDNLIETLPPSFANIKSFREINFNRNPIRSNNPSCTGSITTHEDIKLLFDEMGIPLPDFKFSTPIYAMALAKRVSDFYYKNQWAKAAEYAQRAMLVDSAAYKASVRWDEIGICHFYLRDYHNAINDFEHFMEKEAKTNIHWGASLQLAGKYKADAHLALNQPEKAAETYLYFAKKYDVEAFMQTAAIIYKRIGNDTRYKQLMDTTIAHYQHNLDFLKKTKQKYQNPVTYLDFAEVLIMADKPARAIEILMEPAPIVYGKKYAPVKNYLLASAQYLVTPASYTKIKQTLTNQINTDGKVTGWDYSMFNTWMQASVIQANQKADLMTLQTISK